MDPDALEAAEIFQTFRSADMCSPLPSGSFIRIYLEGTLSEHIRTVSEGPEDRHADPVNAELQDVKTCKKPRKYA